MVVHGGVEVHTGIAIESEGWRGRGEHERKTRLLAREVIVLCFQMFYGCFKYALRN
jgi:hypothetical protein